nr:molecular chaperone [Variovorax boronicumulans]
MLRPVLLHTLGLAACLVGAAAQAQSSLMIWPLDPVIEDDQRAAALWLENRGQQPMSLQIRVLAWSQGDGTDSYAVQETVIASPPMAVVPPGQRQLVRLMNTRPAPQGTELAYRVLVDELPNADGGEDGQRQGSAMGIKLQIRYSVPLFVSGKDHWTKPRADRPRDAATAAKPELRWRTERGMDGHYLFVRNDGRAHARLTAVQWARGNALVTVNPGLLGYVLPGAEMRWKLEQPPPPGHVPQARVNNAEAVTVFVAQ